MTTSQKFARMRQPRRLVRRRKNGGCRKLTPKDAYSYYEGLRLRLKTYPKARSSGQSWAMTPDRVERGREYKERMIQIET